MSILQFCLLFLAGRIDQNQQRLIDYLLEEIKVIRLATRDVHIAGIVPEPHGRWMQQIARNLTDEFNGILNSCKYFIHDRSTLYTEQFRVLLQSAGVQCLRLPPQSLI